MSLPAAVTDTIDWVAYKNNRHLFLTVPEAGKSEIRAPAQSGSGESALPGCGLLASCRVLTWHKDGKGALWGDLHKGTSLVHEGAPSITPQSSTPTSTTLGVSFQLRYSGVQQVSDFSPLPSHPTSGFSVLPLGVSNPESAFHSIFSKIQCCWANLAAASISFEQ